MKNMMKLFSKHIIEVIILTFTICLIFTGEYSYGEVNNAQDVVNDMKIGWNLGNTFDSIDNKKINSVTYYETLWNNPVTMESDIIAIKKAGFNAIRIPVTYYDHVNAEGIIDFKWLDRIEEVVNYVLNNGMYCIINLHHDTGNNAWIKADMDTIDENASRVQNLWAQIAEKFIQYDQKLVFEGFNEILDRENNWVAPKESSLQATNILNQKFVDTVRESGGNNKNRYLVVNFYAASYSEKMLNYFQLPSDIVEDHLIVEVHCYDTSKAKIDEMISYLKERFINKGIPVIIGEFGMKNGQSGEMKREDYASYLISKTKSEGITCFWWDDGGKYEYPEDVKTFALLKRGSSKWYFPEVVKACVTAAGVTDNISIPPIKNLEESESEVIYTQLEWIETKEVGSGFNLECEIDNDTIVEIGVAYIKSKQYADLFCAMDSALSRIQFRQEVDKLTAAYGWYNEIVEVPILNEKFIIRQEGNQTYINNKLVQSAIKQNFKVSNDAILAKGEFRIYYCKVWESGKLVRDFIPVIDSKGNKCLFDKKDVKFYYTDQLIIAGDSINNDTNDGTDPSTSESEAETVEDNSSLESSESIENNHQILKYIETQDVNSYIDTGLCVDQNMSIYIKAMCTDLNSYGYLLNGYDNSTKRIHLRQEKGKILGAYGWYNELLTSIENQQIIEVKINKNQFFLDEQLMIKATKQEFNTKNTLKIMMAKCRLYDCKIWNNGILVRDFEPVLDFQGRACLWDKVEKKYYYSSGREYMWK
ncbi:MAG TPA: glycoside hydrolase family 5 protein [Candidatus Fimimorpha faecalis]|uniref:Glycoside hydrolase family 5 protein n=1 Tax=Candidatus Fimimorpha faecalis TaxID=2840824 RepID=A0A9D1EEK1_9FIRM|nr:glycoside hydrolase family 5 protein [Candidatus Fimimorpha faecalis]